MFFRFPPDARWKPDRNAVEFSIGVGEYEGVVRVPRRVFQILLPEAPHIGHRRVASWESRAASCSGFPVRIRIGIRVENP